MVKEKFVLVSLKENKAKELAQVISNESCRKILDQLAEKESTESELAKKLELPISTVHYNLKHLVGAGLVEAEEFHYSEKGKEVNHYKLANKYVIIAPKSTFGLKEKLKNILPVGLITIAASGLIYMFKGRTASFGTMQKTSIAAAPEAERMLADQVVAQTAPIIGSESNTALWFLIGALSALILYLLISYIRRKK